jgi:DnaJ-class molecular chaperone
VIGPIPDIEQCVRDLLNDALRVLYPTKEPPPGKYWDTPKVIARRLGAKGIVGRVNDCKMCPLAQYAARVLRPALGDRVQYQPCPTCKGEGLVPVPEDVKAELRAHAERLARETNITRTAAREAMGYSMNEACPQCGGRGFEEVTDGAWWEVEATYGVTGAGYLTVNLGYGQDVIVKLGQDAEEFARRFDQGWYEELVEVT